MSSYQRIVSTTLLAFCATATVGAQGNQRNSWHQQYRTRTPADIAAQFESNSRPVFRHRAAIVDLLDLKAGMAVAEIGAGSGFLSRMIAARVGKAGRAIATELDDKMVEYMSQRALSEGLLNFKAIKGSPTSTGLEASSVDAILIVNTFSFFDRPVDMLRSVATSLRAGGLLVVVDFPRTGRGVSAEGIDARDISALATTNGFEKIDEASGIPGHYSLRFRRR